MVNEIQKTMFDQCRAGALQRLCGFKLGIEDQDKIHLKKGKKAMTVTYNKATDDYTVQLVSWNTNYDIKEQKLNNIYCDQLQEIIMNHWQVDIPSFVTEVAR